MSLFHVRNCRKYVRLVRWSLTFSLCIFRSKYFREAVRYLTLPFLLYYLVFAKEQWDTYFRFKPSHDNIDGLLYIIQVSFSRVLEFNLNIL